MNLKKNEVVTITAGGEGGRGQELERLAEMLGEGRTFEIAEKRTNEGMLKTLRFYFKKY